MNQQTAVWDASDCGLKSSMVYGVPSRLGSPAVHFTGLSEPEVWYKYHSMSLRMPKGAFF